MAMSEVGNESVHGSVYDEVYLALKPILRLMRVHGLFPITSDSKLNENVQSVVNNLKFRWLSKLSLLTIVAFVGVFLFGFLEGWDYAPRIPDPLESLIMINIIIVVSLAAFFNLCIMIAQGPNWQAYFKQWQKVDQLLGITVDKNLRSYVKTVSVAYVFYASSAVMMAMYSAVTKYLTPFENDYTGDGFIVGLFSYSIFVNACQLLPELLFTCFARAIKNRLSVFEKRIWRITQKESDAIGLLNPIKLEIGNDLEESRIAYECLTDVISSTNSIMGPVLCVCTLLTSVYLSSTIFILFFQTLDNMGFVYSKLVFSSVCAVRLTTICLVADQIKRKVKQFKRRIYLIPALHSRLTERSMEELTLLLQCITKSSVSFTASDFFDIDKDLLNTATGAILTYTLTIFEFYEKQNDEDKSTCKNKA